MLEINGANGAFSVDTGVKFIMSYLEFEWDEQKNLKNQEKHGIRFEEAIVVFENDMITEIDNRYDYGEIRYSGIGKNIAVYFTIIYTERGEKIRLISARKSNKKERLKYDNYYSEKK